MKKKIKILGIVIFALVVVMVVVFVTRNNDPSDRQEDMPFFVQMVRIPAGTFIMGSPVDEPGRVDNEGPQRQVTLSAFYMGKYPITQAQFEAVMGTTPSWFPGPNRPVESVSWYDAIVFCNRLSIKEGLSPAYEMETKTAGVWSTNPDDWGAIPTTSDARWDAVRIVTGSTGYRLPTEAQWEYACRAGTITAFNTGARISINHANFDNVIGRTIEVGNFEPNAWGLYDMHGNVFEWCWDWFGIYPSEAETNPFGPCSGAERVLRGGSWFTAVQVMRSAFRDYVNPARRDGDLGFRVVRPYYPEQH